MKIKLLRLFNTYICHSKKSHFECENLGFVKMTIFHEVYLMKNRVEIKDWRNLKN